MINIFKDKGSANNCKDQESTTAAVKTMDQNGCIEMLPLFCSRFQFVIVTVRDQKIKQNNENVMCSWYLPWQTLEVSDIAKKAG